MSEPIEALLFDLGKVVIDFDFRRTTQRWAEHAGCDPDELWRRFRLDDAYRKHERGQLDDAGYFAALREMLGIDLSDAQFLDSFIGVIEGAEAWLAPACAALPAYAFSNTNPAHEKYLRANFGATLTPFRKVFTSPAIGMRKPDREAFEFVARAMGTAPGRILFFDDLAANVEGARQAGLQAVHVRSNADTVAALAPYLTLP